MIEPEVSVVLPVLDERDSLEPLRAELLRVLERLGRGFEVIVVDDGSSDGSAALLDRMAAEDRRIRVIHFESHAGQTAAFDAGFRSARGRIVVTMDADGQNDPADLPRLLEALAGGRDAVVGRRMGRRDSWIRRGASRIANAVRNLVSDESIADTGCSLKAFRRECLERIRLYDGLHRFLPTLLKMEGFRVLEIPVNHRPRLRGKSKYDLRRRLVRSVWDLLAVRWMKNRRLIYRIQRGPAAISEKERSSRVG